MGTSAVELDATAVDVTTDDSSLRVVLADGPDFILTLGVTHIEGGKISHVNQPGA